MNRLEESLYNPERRFCNENHRYICSIDPWDKPMFGGLGKLRPIEPIKPIGSVSGFSKEGPENISFNFDLGNVAPEAKGYSLTERYDASHGEFHLNQDVTESGLTFPVMNSGTSKKNDGWKGLGPAHRMSIFSLDDDDSKF